MNALTLKALLLDTIMYLKFGQHINPKYIIAKRALCDALGQPRNISAKQTLHAIGIVYQQNNMEGTFWATVDKYNAAEYLES